MKVLQKDPNAIRFFNNIKWMAVFAVKLNGMSLSCVKGSMKQDMDVVLQAVTQDKQALQFVDNEQVVEQVLKTVKYSCEELKQVVACGIQKNPWLFKFLPHHVQNNVEFSLSFRKTSGKIFPRNHCKQESSLNASNTNVLRTPPTELYETNNSY